MCTVCSGRRERGSLDQDTADGCRGFHRGMSPFLRPLSRAQLLKTFGAGLVAAMAAGASTWDPFVADAAALPYVVLIVLDGARPDYLATPNTPNLQNLIRGGTQYTNAFSGILESETPSGHVTIGTGSPPSKTGIPSFWWGTSHKKRFSLFSPQKIRAGEMEKLIRQSGVPTLAGLVHAKSSGAKVVAMSGDKYYAADAIGGPNADVTMYFQATAKGQFVPTYIPGHAPPAGLLASPGLVARANHRPLGVQNHLVMKLAIDTFSRLRQQVTLINLPEFDWPLGHVDGSILDDNGVKTLMQGFDQDLAALQSAYQKAGVLKNTLFVVMADHGMMPLKHRLPETDFEDAVSRAGTKIVAQTYTTAAYLWIQDSSRARAVAQNIARLNDPVLQSVYARVSTSKGHTYQQVARGKIQASGIANANQHLLASFNGPNAPDVVVVFAEGVGCEPGGQANWKADHGGTSWHAQNVPLVLSGAGIRSGHVSSYPARLI